MHLVDRFLYSTLSFELSENYLTFGIPDVEIALRYLSEHFDSPLPMLHTHLAWLLIRAKGPTKYHDITNSV